MNYSINRVLGITPIGLVTEARSPPRPTNTNLIEKTQDLPPFEEERPFVPRFLDE